MNQLKEILKQKGLKITPQRLAIYGLLKNSKEHPSAEKIHKNLVTLFPTMSLATVYKTIDTFKEIGLVQELNIDKSNFRYDANTIPHPHIICLNCRKVEDLDTSILDNIYRNIQDSCGYKIITHQLYFYGYCPECSKHK